MNLARILRVACNIRLSSLSPSDGERAGVRGRNVVGHPNATTTATVLSFPSPFGPLPFRRGEGNFLALVLLLATSLSAHAALLAYEPFTNAPGTAIIGSSGGSNFSGAWQANSSGGIATNTASGLSYTDAATNTLVTLGGAGFFQGLTSANTSMQPIRPFNFSRGTNGSGDGTTWISFLIVRQGPVNGSATNGWLRGANVPHDLGTSQKLAIGNSSGAATNTVGLIPLGNSTNLKSSPILFGGRTNFIVVRIDHVAGTNNDNAWLFVNPSLATEPPTSAANTNSLGAFDFSFDTLRIFAGGQSSAAQPYAEIIVDEYRVGETYADVAPYGVVVPPAPTGPIIITNTTLVSGGIMLAGIGGTSNGSYAVLSFTNIITPVTNWPAIATNTFDGGGNFACTNPLTPGATETYFRLLAGNFAPPPPVAPSITSSPTNLTVLANQPAAFNAAATGTAPLSYQWLFKTNTALSGATSSNLTLASAQLTNAGGYSLRVANAAGAVTSSIATLTVLAPPVITTQPQSHTILLSNAASFNVIATGTAPLRYQWYFNTNTTLGNATNAGYTIATVLSNNAGTYSVIITNNYGAATSSLATLTVAAPFTGVVFYVATNGNDSSNGSFAAPFKTIAKGHTAVGTGGIVYVRGGTYAITSTLNLNKTANPTNRIRIWAYGGEHSVINAASAGSGNDGISISGDFYHLLGLEVTLAPHNGIKISGDSNIVEYCVTQANTNTGLHLTGSAAPGPTGNLILNCDSYRNYDPPIGGNADGFSAKWDIGPGNIFNGCRAWENSDDGWDLWMGTNPVLITNCWAFRHGIDYWFSGSFNGNGNGFKLGGNYVGAAHVTACCIAFGNASNGYDQNNNTLGQTLDQNTGWNNSARNFNLNHGTNTTPHVVRNNLSFDATSGDSFRSGTVLTSNSWQVVTSPAVSAADVQSVDESVAVLPRNADGSLPVWPFLRPVNGGRLVDKGMDIGQPFNGTAPDLGAYETP